MFAKRLANDFLKFIAVVFERTSVVVVVSSAGVLILQLATETARLSFNLASMPKIDEQPKRLAVTDDVAAIDLGFEADFCHQVFVIVIHLASFTSALVITDDLKPGANVSKFDR